MRASSSQNCRHRQFLRNLREDHFNVKDGSNPQIPKLVESGIWVKGNLFRSPVRRGCGFLYQRAQLRLLMKIRSCRFGVAEDLDRFYSRV